MHDEAQEGKGDVRPRGGECAVASRMQYDRQYICKGIFWNGRTEGRSIRELMQALTTVLQHPLLLKA